MLIRLTDVIFSLDELRGRVSHPPPNNFVYVTNRESDYKRPVLIVLKGGRTSGLTAGVALDVTSTRNIDGEEVTKSNTQSRSESTAQLFKMGQSCPGQN